MKSALKVMSIIAIVLGGLAVLGAAAEPTLADAMYSLVGGLLFLVEGILALIYIGQN